MRKLAPVFFSSLFLIGSTAALAASQATTPATGGTGANEGRPGAAPTTMSSPSTSSSTTLSGSSTVTTSGATGMEKPSPVNDQSISDRNGQKTVNSSTNSGVSASTSEPVTTGKPSVKAKKKQVARNDAKCDESTQAKPLPKECLTKADTGASATNSTQKQSGQ